MTMTDGGFEAQLYFPAKRRPVPGLAVLSSQSSRRSYHCRRFLERGWIYEDYWSVSRCSSQLTLLISIVQVPTTMVDTCVE